ncbi:MAG: hypothetical protein IJV85_04160 [Clostridia bacterium]|nr:hypothetical protein [Clostridia bacterium]
MRHNREKKETVNRKQSDLVTRESLCAVGAIFSLIALLFLITRSLVFGTMGIAVHSLLTGLFGYFAFPLFMGLAYLCATSLFEIKLVKNRKAGLCIALAIVFAALIVHTATTYSWNLKGYLSRCFKAGEAFPKATATGIVGALIVLPVVSLLSKVGGLVLLSGLFLFTTYLAVISIQKPKAQKQKTVKKADAESVSAQPVEIPLSQTPTGQAFGQAPLPANSVEPAVAASETSANFNPAYGNENVLQRLAVRLSDEPYEAQQPVESSQPLGQAFSPFGSFDQIQPIPEYKATSYDDSREFLFGGNPAENYKKNLIFDPNANVNKRVAFDPNQPIGQGGYTPSYTDAYQNSVNSEAPIRPMKILTDHTPPAYQNGYVQEEPSIEPSYPTYEERQTAYDDLLSEEKSNECRSSDRDYENVGTSTPEVLDVREPQPTKEEPSSGYRRHEYMDLFSPSNPNIFGREEENEEKETNSFGRDSTFLNNRDEFEDRSERGRGIDIFDEEEESPYTLRSEFEDRINESVEPTEDRGFSRSEEFSDRMVSERFEEPKQPERIPEPKMEPAPPPPPKPRVIKPYVRLNLDDFDCRDVEPTSNMAEVEETKANIIATLDDFKVTGASIASVTFGPTVTRYNVTIPRNISPKKVVALDQSIAISLHSSGVNIYPNYEDGVVSIEVPNKVRQFVQLGCMLTGDTFQNAKPSSLMFTMGKDVGNRKVYGDISKMIHLLVAGASGAGKSVFLGSLIISLIYKYSPEELRLILIDPKKTEFVLYNDLPHLMVNEIITDVNKAVQSLNWAIGEMNRRYALFEQMSRSGTYVVNLDDYNSHLEKAERLPKIVIIIDELADLMLAAKKEIEDRIQNLTQKARAAGIHLIVATQRPSTDVITGVIKSNLPTRIAFAVASDVDSRVILDQTGAQKLLGKGDFLYTMQGINTPVRVQSAFISSEDSQRVVNFIKANNEAYYDESATAYINNSRSASDGGSGSDDEVEAVYIEALRLVILTGSASISMIQRKCSVGYNKAGKIIEWMEETGYISPFDGAKARKVLITKEEFESKYGAL